MQDKTLPSKSIDTSITNSANTNDVSFSIPQWKYQELQSINKDYEKKIYNAVPLSLTDFNTVDEVQFMSKPQKPQDQRFAYQRKLLRPQDFSILAFILCLQQTLLGDHEHKDRKIQIFKKKISDLDLCIFQKVPAKVEKHYNNKILKKILFQYINKGSYNVSLLQILLRKNHLLKFALSLVSKTILKRNELIDNYEQTISCYVQMKVCGGYFEVFPDITVKDKSIESQNFYIKTNNGEIYIYRKQNIIRKQNSQKLQKQNSHKGRRAITPSVKHSSRIRDPSPKKQTSKLQHKNSKLSQQQYFTSQLKKKRSTVQLKNQVKRSNSLGHFFRKFICFD